MIHNLITSRARARARRRARRQAGAHAASGHSFIKATMAETGAVFGGEHSGHFYFRDFWRADSGMLAALHALAALADTDRPLSELLADYERYVVSGEINSTVADPAAVARRDRGGVRRRGRRRGRPPRRAHRRPPTTGGSTSGRPTPSRCCGSTSRASDDADHARVRDDVLALIRSNAVNLDPPCWRSSSARLPRAARADGGGAGLHRAAASPTRCATTSRSCWSTRPADPADRRTRRWRPGSTSPASTTKPPSRRADAPLRALAESGARVRREAGEAAEALAAAVARSHGAAAAARHRRRRPGLPPAAGGARAVVPGAVRGLARPGLPGWAGGLDLVVVLAPDGVDAATASAVAEAVRRGCQVVVACPPRSLVAEHAQGR